MKGYILNVLFGGQPDHPIWQIIGHVCIALHKGSWRPIKITHGPILTRPRIILLTTLPEQSF